MKESNDCSTSMGASCRTVLISTAAAADDDDVVAAVAAVVLLSPLMYMLPLQLRQGLWQISAAGWPESIAVL